MAQPRIPDPQVELYIWGNAKDEIRALLLFVRYQWYVILLVVLAIGVLVHYLKPFPPSTIRMATGQPNSTLEVLGKKYQERFAKTGVTIELLPSRGAADSLALLKSGHADVALSQGGLEIAKESGLVSLGSMGYQPLWLFHTGPDFTGDDLFEYLRGKRVYVGVEGSGTRIMVDALLKETDYLDRPVFQPESGISARESVDALLSGRLDAVFLIAGYESGNAQALFKNPAVSMVSFPIAEALARRINYIDTVSIPRGAIAISPVRPKSDIQMIATTTTLLARADLHHAIQNLLLTASKDIYNTERFFFDRPGGFPAFTDKSAPRSEVAEKYYQRGGAPFFSDYVPYWLASFIDLAWFSLLTAFAVIYPLFRMVPAYRKYIFGIFASRLYSEIFVIEQALYRAQSAEELTALRPKINAMSHKVQTVWAPKGRKEAYSFVIAALEVLVLRANERFLKMGLEKIDAR
jgi:uncharacterized protein